MRLLVAAQGLPSGAQGALAQARLRLLQMDRDFNAEDFEALLDLGACTCC